MKTFMVRNCKHINQLEGANFPFLVVFNSVLSLNFADSLQSHGLQHSRLPHPSPTPGTYSNSCQWSRWYPPTISSSVVPFSFSLQCFQVSGSFPMSQFFASGGQSIGVSALASVLPMNIQDWFSVGWTGWISLQSKGLSESSPTPQLSSISFWLSAFLWSNCHIHTWLLEKP